MVADLTSQVCHQIDGRLGYVTLVIDALLHTVREDGGPWVLSDSRALMIALTVSQRSFVCPRPLKDRRGLTVLDEKRSIGFVK
jgi:hypothetical protein